MRALALVQELSKHIHLLEEELEEDREGLAAQRKDLEILENNLCESKLMVCAWNVWFCARAGEIDR